MVAWVALLVVGLLAGCVGLPAEMVREGRAFVSPVGGGGSVGDRPQQRYRYFFPLWLHEPAPTPTVTPSPMPTVTPRPTATATAAPMAANKLGIGGCVGSCGVLGCSWCYSWTPNPETWPGVDHERVAMVWGAGDVGKTLGGNSIWLMGFNEPDLDGQANLSPARAAELWRQVEQLYPSRKLVAPAPSHLHPEWIGQFRDAYIAMYQSPPRLDALAFHCYWTAAECIRIGKQFVAWAQAWGVPEVWCTEFAFVPAWNADAAGDARRFVAWLEGERVITRYAPFVSYIRGGEAYWPDTRPEANPSVLTATGELTVIGRWYARATDGNR